MIEVMDPGLLLTVQDAGRRGMAHLGVPRSGAADAPAARRANALVGNASTAAVLEATLTGAVLATRESVVVAVSGAPAPVFVGDVPAPMDRPIRLGAGQTLEIGHADAGLRTYLAVRGGVEGPLTLGSRATDTLSGLGPAPLKAGDRIAVGTASAPGQELFAATHGAAPTIPGLDEVVELEVWPGPRADWISGVGALAEHVFHATTDSNRIGLRLSGGELAWSRTGELPSEGIVAGAIQVPPSGQPVVFLADHPTTGGYPVVGVLDEVSLALATQCRPGQRVRLRMAR